MLAFHVRDLMTEDVHAVHRNRSVSAVRQQMLDGGYRHVPVIDGEDELVGIISDRDILVALGELVSLGMADQEKRLARLVAGDIMRTSVDTVDPEDDLATAANAMLENKYSCLPVVDGAHLVGIITESDFVRHVAGGPLIHGQR